MTTKRVMPLVAAALALGLALLLVAESSARPAQQPGASDGPELAALQNARDATAAYIDPAAASAAGYELFTDNAGLACIEQPGDGAMGVHFVKGALVQGGTIDAARPQALVYEYRDGGLRLVALEYVAIQAAWDSAHSTPPSLFGQQFMLTPAGNRFGLPPFYMLHAWVWKTNPSGMFSPWNPSVSCGAPLDADTASLAVPAPMGMEDQPAYREGHAQMTH